MKVRGAMIQGALALAGLGAAYATWQREPEKAGSGDVVVIDAGKADVTAVKFEDDKSWVELSRRREGGESQVWVKIAAKPDAKPPQPERELRGNEQAERLLDGFGPLRATRALGVFEPGKLKEFGLAAPDVPDGGAPPAWKKKTITVTARGDQRAFTAGTPPAAFTTYLRDERDGRVFVLGGSVLSELESAGTRMVERKLHAFKDDEFDTVVIEAGGKRRELVAMPPDPMKGIRLASKKTPDQVDETAKNWHDKVYRAWPVEVLGKGEQPVAGAPQPQLKVTWLSKGKEKGFIEIGKVTPAAAPPPPPPAPGASAPATPPPPAPEFYARSEHSAGWVKLSTTIDESLKEAEKIVSAE